MSMFHSSGSSCSATRSGERRRWQLRESIGPDEARRIALTAQGFNAPARPVLTARDLNRAVERLGLLQIDSVNVLLRAHYLPIYARAGAYDRTLLDEAMAATSKRMFEYWGHEASLLPVASHPLLRWRMERAQRGEDIWTRLRPFAGERRGEAEALLRRIASDGPIAASDLTERSAGRGMWAWSEGKHALEWLFWAGLVAATHRRRSFERVYDLPGRVLPARVLELPTPTEADAYRSLLARAAERLGIATADDLRDYYRLPTRGVAERIAELVEQGTLSPVRVRGWAQPAYLHRDARAGRRIAGTTLLSPFDPLIWHRGRTERLFGFRYRLEIYTPAAQREHGYYAMPFLLDGRLVARADLKADRARGALVVRRISLEPDAPAQTIARLGDEFTRLAAWLGLHDVVAGDQ